MNSVEHDLEPYIQKFILARVGKLVQEGELLPEALTLAREMADTKLEIEGKVGALKAQELVEAVRNVDFVVEEHVYRAGLAEGAVLSDTIQRLLFGR